MILILTLFTFLLGTFTGWAGHWVLHQPWAGRFYQAHMTHHKLYPPTDLTSKDYREPGRDDTTLLLGPLIAGVILCWLLLLAHIGVGWLEIVYIIALSSIVGYAHEWLHQAFHVRGHWLNRLSWFRTLKAWHFIHHRRAKANLGIVWYGWDRLFKTFRR